MPVDKAVCAFRAAELAKQLNITFTEGYAHRLLLNLIFLDASLYNFVKRLKST
jgi:hypothetical protein